MRDKEAIENERKNLVRTLERQGKAVDRLTDVEKHLRFQMVSYSHCASVTKSDLTLL